MNIRTAILYPFGQAVAGGLLAGVLVGLVAGWRYAPVSGALVAFFYWLLCAERWRVVLERVIGVDLNHDGVIGASPDSPQAETVRVEISRDNGRSLAFADLPATPAQLSSLVRGLLAGVPFAESSWIGAGRAFSKAEFRTLRDVLIARGLAAWENPRSRAQGVELTAAGRAVMRRLADSPTLPERESC